MGKPSRGLLAVYAVFSVAAILLLGAIQYSNQKNRAVSRAFERQAEFNRLGRQLAAGSDYLTNEVRKYVVTTDIEHLNNYWNEIYVTRSRDKVLLGLKELHAPAGELALLTQAKANSDALVATETRGMKLVLVARGASFAGIPRPVATWHLSASDAALPPAAKLDLARQLQFNRQYDHDKALIMDPVAQFQESVRRRTSEDVSQAQAAAQDASRTLMVAGLLAIISMTLAFSISSWQSAQRTRRVHGAIGAVAESSEEILVAMLNHEKTVAEQAVAVNETTTTMDQFEASFQQTRILVDDSSASTLDALKAVTDGQLAVQQTRDAFQDLRQKVAIIAGQILQLSQRTGQINSITNDVVAIAAQTNMLALNAAVEAARAGEHGKGFAVVASEIRKLADQSRASAERITGLVEEIQKATNSTAQATDNGTKTVDQGIRLAQDLNKSFEKIMFAIDGASQSAQQIAVSIQQESLAIQQVLDAMGAINHGARETADGIKQTQQSVEKLNETARGLTKLA